MTTEPKPEEIVDLSGPQGETIFRHPLAYIIADHGPQLQSELDEMWTHYKDISDERLLALVAALCIENAVQGLLESFSSGFAELREDSGCTFSLKIKMARALRLVPARIFASCDLIRQIRNEFAHHLHKKELSQLDENKYLQKLAAHVAAFNPAERDKDLHAEMFKQLVSFVIIALRTYTHHVLRLREYLDTMTFQENLKRRAETK